MAGPGFFLGRGTVPSAAKGTLPNAGEFHFYIDSVDDHWKFIDSAGTVVDITDTGASTFPDVTIADATPQLTFKDTDCTDSDDNATLTATATATGSGAEDIDVALAAQANGVATNIITYDASADGVSIGNASASLVGFYGEAGANKAAANTAIDATAINLSADSVMRGVLSNVRLRLNETEASLIAMAAIN